MDKKIWDLLKTPIVISERSWHGLQILKRVLFFVFAVFVSVFALPKAVFLAIARIDMWEELQEITKIDLWTGPVASLIVFLLAHDYLPQGKMRRFAMIFYLVFAVYISAFFLMMHINQVSVRGGGSQIKIILSLLKNDK